MNSIQHLLGSSVLSSFRRERLLQRFAELDLPVADINGRFEHYVWTEAELNAADQARLEQLLDYGSTVAGDKEGKNSLVLRVFPRPGTVSPWASKASDIAHNCGLPAVRRIERGIRYTLTPSRGLLGSKSIDAAQLAKIADCLHDRMTETVMDVSFDGSALFASLPGKPIQTINVIDQGQAALVEANRTLGLALSDDEVEYLETSFRQLGRNPTDVELMMFAQANSEHCRHKIFNAQWVIDGEKQSNTLFGMIRATHAAQPEGTVVAYSDNSAIMSGGQAMLFHAGAYEFHRHLRTPPGAGSYADEG